MYEGSGSLGCANAIFSEIRNTPLESLNTEGFRSRIRERIKQSSGYAVQLGEEDDRKAREESLSSHRYDVHFLKAPSSDMANHAEVHSFRNFPGLYLVRNYLTPLQCRMLLWKTLTDYINPPSNSNLLQLHPQLTAPIWPSSQFKKLKWATIGHMYDWGTRSYRGYTDFPRLLVDISQNLVSQLGADYVPDAAIINCYTKGYFLRLHKDDAEETDDAVLNISLGAPAIFLVGGNDQSKVPVSMVVEAGSVVVMTEKSRFCLHGISKLLSYNKPGYEAQNNAEADLTGQLYAEPKLERIIRQCPNKAFDDINLDCGALETMKTLESELRVSVSIRRAKVNSIHP